MRILVTGATGVLGRAALPHLIEAGHEVSAVAHTDRGSTWLADLGVSPIEVDLFDPDAVGRALAGIDVVIHLATSIPPLSLMGKRETWRLNDRLRDQATRLLVDTAVIQGVQRFIQESVTFFYADGGDSWLDESAPISPSWEVLDSALAAEGHVARFGEAGGTAVVLRLSRLYGPGPASGEYLNAVSARKMPVVGKGDNFVSSLHIDDAGTALAASLTAPGDIYNVADDDPVRSKEYLGILAAELGAPTPRRVPAWMARVATGRAVGLLTTSHRVSNQAFKEATPWSPSHRSVRDGWPQVVADRASGPPP